MWFLLLLHRDEFLPPASKQLMVSGLPDKGRRDCNWDMARVGGSDEDSDVDDCWWGGI